MIIPINLSPASDSSQRTFPPQLAQIGTSELVILEMQGFFHIEGGASADLVTEAKGKHVAKLTIEADNKPTLLVGHNLLEGKVVTLAKPLAVLHKKPKLVSSKLAPAANEASMDIDGEIGGEEHEKQANDGSGSVEYDMVALVTKKLVFSKRPMPVVKMVAAGANV